VGGQAKTQERSGHPQLLWTEPSLGSELKFRTTCTQVRQWGLQFTYVMIPYTETGA
jgi:hypothetical protein